MVTLEILTLLLVIFAALSYMTTAENKRPSPPSTCIASVTCKLYLACFSNDNYWTITYPSIASYGRLENKHEHFTRVTYREVDVLTF